MRQKPVNAAVIRCNRQRAYQILISQFLTASVNFLDTVKKEKSQSNQFHPFDGQIRTTMCPLQKLEMQLILQQLNRGTQCLRRQI